MARKLTLEQVEKAVAKTRPSIKIMETEYKDARTKMRCVCKDCGYEYYATYVSLTTKIENKTGCKKCNGRLKKTFEEIIEHVANISPSVEILSTECKNVKARAHCRCKICNHEWFPFYYSLNRGAKCPKCSRMPDKTIEEVKNDIFEKYPNVIVLDTEYKNCGQKLHLKCSLDSYEWTNSYKNIMNDLCDHRCPRCSGRERMTISIAIEKTKILAPNIEILSDKCESTSQSIECRCKVCGHVWNTSMNRISQGTNCIMCFRETMKGETHPMWKGGITVLNNYLRAKIDDWRNDTIQFYDSKCAISGDPYEAIHHLYPFSKIVKEALLRENLKVFPEIGSYTHDELERLSKTLLSIHFEYGLGICLTKKYHLLFHNNYGRHENTPEQFDEFLVRIKRGEIA